MDRRTTDALRGRVFAERYRIEDRIGDGAMGVVYRASHVKLARAFAVKVLHRQLLASDKIRRRFEREAEVAARLRHDNVIGVVDVGETTEGLRYLVMDFAEGVPLSTLIAQGPMKSARVRAIAAQLCDGLQHAHDTGLIHRDFKPDNVIVHRDREGTETPRIVDFGIALETSPEERERLTTAGIVLGTPYYMAPEHASGAKVDHRIDLFALGVICFEMLTGRLPFDGDGADVARAYMIQELPKMRHLVPGLEVDPLLEAFTRKLMARAPAERIPSARVARDLLELIESDRGAAATALGIARTRAASPTLRPLRAMPAVAANTDTLQTQAMPALRRHRWLIASAACVFGLGAGVAALRKGGAAMSPGLVASAQAAPVFEPEPLPAPAIAPAPVTAIPLALPRAPRIASPANQPIPPIVAAPPVALPMPETIMRIEFREPAEPTAAEVAELYAIVGRKLSALEKTHGQLATLELWPRFRNVRIQAMLADALDRKKAALRLREIETMVDEIIVNQQP